MCHKYWKVSETEEMEREMTSERGENRTAEIAHSAQTYLVPVTGLKEVAQKVNESKSSFAITSL